VGASDFSGITTIGFAALPAQPNQVTKVESLSTSTRLVLSWTAPTTSDAPAGDISGYRLELDDGLGGNFTIVYDSTHA
jgi:hypothetical protein